MSEDQSQALKDLLTRVGIRRIVCVDDDFAISFQNVFELTLAYEASDRAALLAGGYDPIEALDDVDVWRDAFLDAWESMEPADRQNAFDQARAKVEAQEISPEVSTEVSTEDAAVSGVLGSLFAGFDVRSIGIVDWEAESANLIQQCRDEPTLFLFDRSFVGEGRSEREGENLVRSTLEQTSASSWVGMLTHTVSPEDEVATWNELKSVVSAELAHRFVVISKGSLLGGAEGFLRRVRFALLAPYFSRLSSAVVRALEEVNEEARNRIESLSPYDYEDAVFALSAIEGVWEPDTVLRLFAIAQGSTARTRLRGTAEVHELTSVIRRIVDDRRTATDSNAETNSQSSSAAIAALQRDDIYESAEYVNDVHLPVESGDIFMKDSGKRYILIAQPCDLMVRSNGRRAPELTCVSLAEVREGDPSRPAHFELPFFRDSSRMFVDLGRIHYLRVEILDLSVFNSDGALRLPPSAVAPERLIPAWTQRYPRIQEWAIAARDAYSKYKSEGQDQTLQKLIFPPGPFRAAIGENDIGFDARRIMRLKDPYARALLSRYAHHLSRDAFEPNLTSS